MVEHHHQKYHDLISSMDMAITINKLLNQCKFVYTGIQSLSEFSDAKTDTVLFGNGIKPKGIEISFIG